MENLAYSAALRAELAQLSFYAATEAEEFRRELATLAAHPALRSLLAASLLPGLLGTYRREESRATELGRQLRLAMPVAQRPVLLLPYFASLLPAGSDLPGSLPARSVLVTLAERGIDPTLIRDLLRTGRLAKLSLATLAEVSTGHPYSLAVWITFLGLLTTADLPEYLHEAAALLLLREMYCTDLNEGSAARLRLFLRDIFPAFAERFAAHLTPPELAGRSARLVTWYQVWLRHRDRAEPRLLPEDPYYTTEFGIVVRNVPLHLWWNAGIAYGEAGLQYTFGSPGFAYLAAGGSIRKNPYDYRPYTRRMARAFVSLPWATPSPAGDRYLELYARSLGAGPLLRRLCQRYVGHPVAIRDIQAGFDRWNPVLQKLADPAFESLGEERALALLGYCYHRLRDRIELRVNRRSVADLVRAATAYYARIRERRAEAVRRAAERESRPSRDRRILRWNASQEIQPFERLYGRYARIPGYKIVELLNENQLTQEGQLMKHCVGTYQLACARSNTTIWSLRTLDRAGLWHSRVTIEVRYPLIVQARGKYNADPEGAELEVIRDWAQSNRLIFTLLD